MLVDGLKSIPTKWTEPTALVMLELFYESKVLIFERPGRHLTKLVTLILHFSSGGTADVVAADFNPPN
jgi:hypothetical protein